jgi:fumarate reductase flavoprotein subunit
LLVFGARAGHAAAALAADEQAPGRHLMAQALDEESRLHDQFLSKKRNGERIATLREEMQKTMEGSAGIYRSGDSLSQAAGKLAELQERFQRVSLDDRSQAFNTELVAALELSYLLDVAEAMVQCALQRTESRGAHQRTDFPERNDKDFLAHSLVHRSPGGPPRVEYLPVTITRWPPAERVYGR